MLLRHQTLASIALASLLATFAAQANKGASYHQNDAEDFKWFITGGATYLAPTYDALEYFAIATDPSLPEISSNTKTVSPSYAWGYFLEAGYKIRPNFDIQASWTALDADSSDSASAAGPGTVVILSNLFGELLDVGESATAHSSETLNYQAFDTTIGQYHTIVDHLTARLFAGIRYAKIDLDTDNTYTISDIPSPIHNNYDSSFSGWGPELGMDLEYKIHNKVNVVGHFAAAFLIGNQEAESSTFFDSTPTQVDLELEKEVRTVPGIDAKLGINVDIPFMKFTDSILIEGGYQVAYYFDAITIVDANATTALGFGVQRSDVSMMGPYLNVSLLF